MTFVLVHGGGFGASCWEPLIPYLEGEVHAVDLPGRGRTPGDLAVVGIDDFVDTVVSEIDSNDLGEVTLVGHSMAGLTLPGWPNVRRPGSAGWCSSPAPSRRAGARWPRCSAT